MDIHDIRKPFLRHFRKARNLRFVEQMKLTSATTVLDVGGTHYFWEEMPVQPEVTLVNLEQLPQSRYKQVNASACSLPFPDKSFDIVFSNSTIEHLGTWENQALAAQEMLRVGKRLWVQTPYQWFPVEPHYVTPAVHWLPKKVRRALLPYTVWGLTTHPSKELCDAWVDEIQLLNIAQMKQLFPQCDVTYERFGGLVKSLIAVRAA